MAKYQLDHFVKKYGWRGHKYRALMSKIIAHNSEHVARAIGRLTNENYSKAVKKISTKERRFIVPDVQEVLPKRSVFIRKGADRGWLLTDSIRTQLSKDLREAMKVVTPKTGEARFIKRRGRGAGRVSPKIIKEFEARLSETFKGYVAPDKKIGVPRNIHHIAVTEMRSVADDIKYKYASTFTKRNPDVVMKKRWVHNTYLSKAVKWIRKGHDEINGDTVGLHDKFMVRNDQTGAFDEMLHPHSPGAPAEQVIGCHCDVEYFAAVRKKKNVDVYKSYYLWVEKGKKEPLGTIKFRESSKRYFKKIRQTGEPHLDWVPLKNVKFDAEGKPTGGTTEGGLETENLKFVSEVSRECSAMAEKMMDNPQGKKFIADAQKIYLAGGNANLTYIEKEKFVEKIKAFRDSFFAALNISEGDKKYLDSTIDSWLGSSSSNGALYMQYLLMKSLGENEKIGKRFRFLNKEEAENAKQFYDTAMSGNPQYVENFKRSILAQFSFTRAIHEKVFKDSENIKLYRRIGSEQKQEMADEFKTHDTAWFACRPMSSWTSDSGFGLGSTRVVTKHPLQNCFASYLSHGLVTTRFQESEFIMYGHGHEVDRKRVLSPPSGLQMPEKQKPGEAPAEQKPAQKPVMPKVPYPQAQKPEPKTEPEQTGISPENAKYVSPPKPGAGTGHYSSSNADNMDFKNVILTPDGTQRVMEKTFNGTFHKKEDALGGSKDDYSLINNIPFADTETKIKVNEKAGGTTGAVFAMVSGELLGGTFPVKAVVKKQDSPDGKARLKEEFLADHLYRILGVPVAQSTLRRSADGSTYKISRKIEGGQSLQELKQKADSGDVNAKYSLGHIKETLQNHFVIDAVLGNWDAIGLNHDNILIKDNVPYRIDNGGALRYRAQGAPKGDKFGDIPKELTTLQDPKMNPSAASIYGGMKKQDMVKQINNLYGKKDAISRAIKRFHGNDTFLHDKIMKRLENAKIIGDAMENAIAMGKKIT